MGAVRVGFRTMATAGRLQAAHQRVVPMATHVSSCRFGVAAPFRGSRLVAVVALVALTAAVAVAREAAIEDEMQKEFNRDP